MKLFSYLGAVIALAPVGAAAQTSVTETLRHPPKPISLAELPSGLTPVVFGQGEMGISTFALYGGMGMPSSGGANGRPIALFTLLGTTFVQPDEFADLLMGKLPRIRGYVLDIPAMMASTSASSVPNPQFTESWIEAGRVAQWSVRPSLSKESLLVTFSDSVREGPGDSTHGLSNIKQLALGAVIYSADYDDKLPSANSTGAVHRALQPYLKNDALWQSPNGGRVLYNTSLSGVETSALERPAETLVFWEEKTYPDGTRAVAYVDGHARLLPPDAWDSAWKQELRRRELAKKTAPKRRAPAQPAVRARASTIGHHAG